MSSICKKKPDGTLASVQGIINLCAGLPIALTLTGDFVAAEVSDGLEFEYACDNYLKDLEHTSNFGATILEAAIRLSLDN